MASGLAAGTVLASCNRVDFGPKEGYTEKDVQNYPTGEVDKTDWTADGSWDKQERDLFKDSGVNLNAAGRGAFNSIGLYPNPCAEYVHFYLGNRPVRNTPAPAAEPLQMRAVVVDKKYRPVHRFAGPANAGSEQKFAVQFPADKFEDGKLYRLYYVVYDANNQLYLKGHGDIKIKR
ncbi:hypothetical protein D3Y59_16430 [Hymenobacter oligotrophus]|uniref:Uncharacterized protein n=1 Tax=Hymenobacter oligotrophus TaxID=2319843 RepID=A0A3B7R330_9BACT|nr:hypothetical protein D3Y59_16430 [Hymenobacter oligotrophus]